MGEHCKKIHLQPGCCCTCTLATPYPTPKNSPNFHHSQEWSLAKVGWTCSKNVDQKIKFLVIYHLRRYWHGITPSESVKVRHYPLVSENWTITWKRYKIVGKSLLITNRKSYMSFQLVPKSVTLNDLERRNSHNFA